MLQIIQHRKIYLAVSVFLVGVSLLFLAMWGLRPGIDFTGGSLLNLRFAQERPGAPDVNALMKGLNLKNEILVQPAGSANLVLRFQDTERATYEKIMSALKEKYPDNVQEESFESIGPAVGQEIKTKAIYAIVLSVIAIMIYIAWAFRKVSWPVKSWKYSVAAIIALIHDIIIPLGVFSLLGRFFNIEVGLPFVAALLTILGYSVNDTIVIFDRTR
ncbi:MAG: protein translocase subunit SecF, partial [Parcubacteria group bacterium]